jgi:hypothetical protein
MPGSTGTFDASIVSFVPVRDLTLRMRCNRLMRVVRLRCELGWQYLAVAIETGDQHYPQRQVGMTLCSPSIQGGYRIHVV